jgi:hypothetical protein
MVGVGMKPTLPYRRRDFTASLVLAILLFRAYVPLGFMPASGTPFLLEICPSGPYLQMSAHHAHHHSGSDAHFSDCPFGSAPAAGPISHFIVLESAGQIASQPVLAFAPVRLGVRLERAHQPRGPPTLA